MGTRILVVLDGDAIDQWVDDPRLGYRIAAALQHPNDPDYQLPFGKVVEQSSTNTQSLVHVYGTTAETISQGPYLSSDDLVEGRQRLIAPFSQNSQKGKMGWTGANDICN